MNLTDKIQVFNQDCLPWMREQEDKSYSLAIVDPPYGMGQRIVSGGFRGSKFEVDTNVDWDVCPSPEYWIELKRVSWNQIVWGGNYFLEHLSNTRCILIWDKEQEFTGADFELAWTSFDLPAKAFRMSRVEAYQDGKIHICQKPVQLYRWLLKNYAKEGDRILDTHGGSLSIAIACHIENFELTVCELDKGYFDAGCKRFREVTAQQRIFQ